MNAPDINALNTSTPAPLLEARGVTLTRGSRTLVARLDWQARGGQLWCLLGPNGVGKTTLLRTLAGLQPVLAGQIDGPMDQSAYASHADGVKSTLTVTENLGFWAAVYGQPLRDAVVADFDLTALRDRMAGTLSAGQKRRVGLARLAVIGRKMLFLDEPTVSLDAASVALFRGFLERHLAAGGAAVMATHIDLGIIAPELDLTGFRATAPLDAAFL